MSTQYSFDLLLDTANFRVAELNVIWYYPVYNKTTKAQEMRETLMYRYVFAYGAKNQLDSVVQTDKFNRPEYVYRILRDSSIITVEKRQMDNNRLWFVMWHNARHDACDSIQYYTYNSFDPYTPIRRDRNYFFYNDSTSHLKSAIYYDEVKNSKTIYWDEGTNAKPMQIRLYTNVYRNWGRELSANFFRHEYSSDGKLLRTSVYSFNGSKEIPQPSVIPETATPTIYTYAYNDNNRPVRMLEFYEDKCITKNNVTEYAFTERGFVREARQTPNIVTRCKY